MLRLGEKQELIIVKKTDFGVYLSSSPEEGEKEKVLLPIKQVPEGKSLHDKVEVFIYRDSKDRMIASTRMPFLTLHEVGLLQVKEVARIGAFLDWGLEKDLLLPFAEQTRKVRAGETVLAAVYIDKSNRLCATMNVYPYLQTQSDYRTDDQVEGRVYQISDNFGAFVAVDDKYSGLIPQKEMYGKIQIGDVVKARVTEVKEDGKLDLSIRQKAYLQIGTDSEKILKLLDSYEGVLPFNDKARPEIIKRETGMSKNEFKRAVGHLLKEGKIEIGEKVIRRLYRTEDL